MEPGRPARDVAAGGWAVSRANQPPEDRAGSRPTTTSVKSSDVEASGTLRVGVPRPLFEFGQPTDPGRPAAGVLSTRYYHVPRDGQHFYGVRYYAQPPTPPVTQIHLVTNWLEELKAKVLGVSRPALSNLLNRNADLSGEMALRIERPLA